MWGKGLQSHRAAPGSGRQHPPRALKALKSTKAHEGRAVACWPGNGQDAARMRGEQTERVAGTVKRATRDRRQTGAARPQTDRRAAPYALRAPLRPGSCILWVRNPPEFYSWIFGHTHPTRLCVGQTDRSYVTWAGLKDPAYLHEHAMLSLSRLTLSCTWVAWP